MDPLSRNGLFLVSRNGLFSLVAVCGLVFTACTKSAGNTPLTAGPGVYVAGDNGVNPVLWKNGVPEILSSTKGTAGQVTVSGNAVYVSGISGESNIPTPGGLGGEYVYWRDGVSNNIGPVGVGPQGGSASISVSGNNVYYSNSHLWLDGSVVPLPGQGEGYVQSVFTIGNNVYCTGSDSVGDAVYWKNGVLQVLSMGYYPNSTSGSNPFAFCICVAGTDVYVGGNSSTNEALYWKNGVATTLQSTINNSFVTSVHSIFASGNDVYAAAYLIVPANGGSDIPAYWKNGIEQDLPLNGASTGYVTSIFVSGSDVYAAGWTSTGGAVYWKNGVETFLSSHGIANSIYVQ